MTINKTGLDLSGIINTLKRELSTIQNAYKQITFIGVDKDIELRELKKLEGLLDQINKTLNNSQQAMNLATSEKDKEELSKIINILKEQQTKIVELNNKKTNKPKVELDLSEIINTLKRELSTIQNTYKQMTYISVDNDTELRELKKL